MNQIICKVQFMNQNFLMKSLSWSLSKIRQDDWYIINMKPLLIICFYFFVGALHSQNMFSVDYKSQADVNIFVVEYKSQADLLVYKVDYKSQAKGNEGLWYFVDYKSQADFNLYFVDYKSQADLKIYFVEYKSQAGWQSKEKKHLLY